MAAATPPTLGVARADACSRRNGHTAGIFGRHALPPLAQDEIHLWRLGVGALEVRPQPQGSTALLRELLSGYAGTDAFVIERDAHGKPRAPALGGLEFNLSHCRNVLVIAVTREQSLGVDIETPQRRVRSAALAQRFFTRAEATALAALDEAVRAAAFVRLWTHKEAVLKAIGSGLSFGLARLEFRLDAAGEVCLLESIAAEAGLAKDWRLHRFEPCPGFVGCLAWRGPPRRVRHLPAVD